MRFNRAVESTSASFVEIAAPESPLPAPRAITGVRFAFAHARRRETSSVEFGNATASGRSPRAASSFAKGPTRSSSVHTRSSGIGSFTGGRILSRPVELDLVLLRNFAIALFIGALVGIEREKRKERDRTSIGGLRTFMLFAIAGAASAWLSAKTGAPSIFLATGLAVTALLVAGYVVEKKGPAGEGMGLTTEAAALVVFLL